MEQSWFICAKKGAPVVLNLSECPFHHSSAQVNISLFIQPKTIM